MIPSKTQRSLSMLRELSGCGSQTMPPHAAYMKITTVELEKLRLNKARQHALRRVDEIDDRLRELDAKKAALLSAIESGRGLPPPPRRALGAKGLRSVTAGRARLTY